MSDPYQDLADRLKRKDLETSNQFLVAENATLRASLKEAQERVAKIQEAVSERDKQLAAAIESWKLFLAALSRPSPQATPKPPHSEVRARIVGEFPMGGPSEELP